MPIEILVQAKAKEPPTDALPKFIEAYSTYTRVATLVKETYNGKLINEWNQGIDKLATKPEQVDMAPALSTVMAVKDEDELVRLSTDTRRCLDSHLFWQKIIRTAANLTSTLLIHHIVLKLETILDKEAKISHEQFAGQIESRIGTGDGEGAKGPDMKVWSKGRGLSEVRSRCNCTYPCGAYEIPFRSIGRQQSSVTLPLSNLGPRARATTFVRLLNHQQTS